MKKIITNIWMTILVILVFCNLFGIQISVETVTTDNNSCQPIITPKTTDNIDTDNVIVTNESFESVANKTDIKPAKKAPEIIGRSCSSQYAAKGFTNANGVFEYTAENKIECGCRVRASNGTIHDYSKTLVQESNSFDCNTVCDKVCRDFADKIQ